MYCECQPEGSRIEMIPEHYPDPENDTIIHKWLCCGCGYTTLMDEADI